MSGAYRAFLRCSAGCSSDEHELFQVKYRCDACGGLLDVGHQLEALKTDSKETWMKRFDQRALRAAYPYSSGVWSKKEWVGPGIEEQNVISLFEGNTNLMNATKLGRELGVPDLWVKLCGNSHTGSFKDLGMTVLVSAVVEMRSRGVPIKAIACASTGDTSAALAAYGAAAGIDTIVFLPRGKITPAQLIQPLSHGAKVLQLDTDFDGCMALIKKICSGSDSPIYLANSMNPLRLEGQKTVAIEIVQQLGWQVPDWVVIPGGNLGNVSALGAGFDLLFETGIINRRPRICVAQAERANPLYLSYKKGFASFDAVTAQETAASAIRIGDPVSVHRAVRALKKVDGIVEQASEEELKEAAAQGDRIGLFNCPHTGVALAALKKLIGGGLVQNTDRVVVVSTAHGLKFSEFKTAYHTGDTGAHRNMPVELDATEEAVRKAVGL